MMIARFRAYLERRHRHAAWVKEYADTVCTSHGEGTRWFAEDAAEVDLVNHYSLDDSASAAAILMMEGLRQ